MGDAQILQVVQTGGGAVCGGGAGLGQAKELALPLVLDAGAVVDGEVTDVQLVDDRVGVVFGLVGDLAPAVGGIGGIQIDDHAALAVDAGGTGIGVHCLHGLAVHGDSIGVIHPVKIAVNGHDPGAVHILFHVITA